MKDIGVSFACNDSILEIQNFQGRLAALKSVLNIWKMKDLTTIGRIVIVKTLP